MEPRDDELLSLGWQFNTTTGLYHWPAHEHDVWHDRLSARQLAHLVDPPAPKKRMLWQSLRLDPPMISCVIQTPSELRLHTDVSFTADERAQLDALLQVIADRVLAELRAIP